MWQSEKHLLEGNFAYELNFKIPPCVYFLISEGDIVYIGASFYILSRIRQHQKDRKKFDTVHYIPTTKDKLYDDEARFIRRYDPIYNERDYKKRTKRITERNKQLKQRKNTPILREGK